MRVAFGTRHMLAASILLNSFTTLRAFFNAKGFQTRIIQFESPFFAGEPLVRLIALKAEPFATKLTFEIAILFRLIRQKDVLAVWAVASMVLRLFLNIPRNLDITQFVKFFLTHNLLHIVDTD